MKKSIDPFKAQWSGFATSVALVLCCCSSPVPNAQGNSGSPAASVTEITIERDCSGCPTGSVLALHRDGTATYTVTGKARLGTADSKSSGTVRPEEFEKLARFIVSQGFFDLKEQYDDPQTQDGAWTTISVVRGGQDKRVFRRDAAGPASLGSIESAIDAVKARIAFVPNR